MRFLSFRGFFFVLAVVGLTFPLLALAAPSAEWTIMVYMNGKNSLEGDALDNFHSMAKVGSNSKVNYVVELGRPQMHYTNVDGGWSGVYRYHVQKGSKPLPANAVEAVSGPGGVVDMGKPAALDNFIAWTKVRYPAKRYALIVWNHGQGWRLQIKPNTHGATTGNADGGRIVQPATGGYRAVSSDDDTNSILYNSQVEAVVAKHFSNRPLDLIGFDACLMSMIETAYALSPYVNIMVGSEELEPGAGWRYSAWMTKLAVAPEMSGAALAQAWVDTYRDAYGDDYLTTLSSINLVGFRTSAGDISAFSDAVRAAGVGELRRLEAARAQLSTYGDSTSPPLRTSVDFLELLRRYEGLTTNAALKAQSASLRRKIAGHILANYASMRSAQPETRDPYGSNGIAIYFPESPRAFEEDFYKSGYLKTNTEYPVVFVQKERWAELIAAIVALPQNAGEAVSK